jgi:hypothetical protein
MKTIMLRSVLALAVLICLSAPATADCAAEAEAAERAFVENGPFHFETVMTTSRTAQTPQIQRSCGRVNPYIAEARYACEPNDAQAWQTLRIEDRAWERDELGWKPGSTGSGWNHEGLPERLNKNAILPGIRTSGSPEKSWACFDAISADGRRQRVLIGDASSNVTQPQRIDKWTSKIIVDAQTMQSIEYETRRTSVSDMLGHRTQYDETRKTKFKFDPGIRFEVPVVDLDQRKRLSRELFEKEISDTDPLCRERLTKSIETSAQQPFRFAIESRGLSHPTGASGTYKSADQYTFHIYGIRAGLPRDEIGRIGEIAWRRPLNGEGASFAVESVEKLDINDTKVSALLRIIPNNLLFSLSNIGKIECQEDGSFRYKQFSEFNGEWRAYGGSTIVGTDLMGRIAEVRPSDSSYSSGIRESRIYDPTITITPPIFP